MADVFDVVLQTSLYATIVGLIIILFKRILHNKLNAQWHYLIWFVLILKLLIPFGPESVVSLFNVFPENPQQMITEIANDMEQEQQTYSIDENILNNELPIKREVEVTRVKAFGKNPLPVVWVTGALLMLLWLLFTYFLLLKKLQQSSLIVDDRILKIFKKCKAKMRISREVSLQLQDILPSPSLIGIIHPKIILSPSIANLGDKEIEYILFHELAHYKRKDICVNYLLLGFQIVHWFNPVIWYCFKCIRQDMEVATDERVLSILDNTEHKSYGRALLAVLEQYSTSTLMPKLLGMVDDKKNIERRLKMIKMACSFKGKRRHVLVLGLACLIVLGSVLLTNGLSKQNTSPSPIETQYKYNAEVLYKYKTAFVGDNSKVINLIDNLPCADLRENVSLQTKSDPYGITVNYNFGHSDIDLRQIEAALHNNTVLLFTLIDNVDVITYNIIGEGEQLEFQSLRTEVQKNFANSLREYAKDIETLETFVNNLTFRLVVYPEKYTLVMSSTPGICIKAEYAGSVEKVRYSTKKGVLFTWNGNISKGAKLKELPYDSPIFWSPLDRSNVVKSDFVGTDTVVTVTLLDKEGEMIDEKQLNISYDGSMFYTVKPDMNIIIGTGTQTLTEAPKNIDNAIALAMLNRCSNYCEGEVATEGHIILDIEEKDGQVKAYIIASEGNFGFENGIFTKISGSGAIPRVITFSKDKNGKYSMLKHQYPMDGTEYASSIKKMFPRELWDEAFDTDNRLYAELAKQEEVYATEYLKSIGREAVVSAEHVKKELADINVQAANKLTAEYTKYDSFLNACPYWLGTKEQVEQGVRYIYKKSQSKTSDGYDLITFTKSKEDGTVIIERKYKIVGKEPQLIEE